MLSSFHFSTNTRKLLVPLASSAQVVFPATGIRGNGDRRRDRAYRPIGTPHCSGKPSQNMEAFQRSKYSWRRLFKSCKGQNAGCPPTPSLSSRDLSLCGWVGKELAMVVLSPAADRAVSQNRHLARDCLVFSKLSFADQSPRVPPLPVVSPNSCHFPGGQHWGNASCRSLMAKPVLKATNKEGGHHDHSLPLETPICRTRPVRSFCSDIQAAAGRELLSRNESQLKMAAGDARCPLAPGHRCLPKWRFSEGEVP